MPKKIEKIGHRPKAVRNYEICNVHLLIEVAAVAIVGVEKLARLLILVLGPR